MICVYTEERGFYMLLCDRILEWFQIQNCNGDVRLCSWIKDNKIGSLSNNSISEIYHSKRANELREKIAKRDFSECLVDACPYIAMNELDKHMVEVDVIPEIPEKICLAFEEVCNYRCISCTTPNTMCNLKKDVAEKGYDIIEQKLNEVLPYVKTISTNGRGEIFASKRTMKILSEWQPLAPKEEVTIEIETNGSLFDEEHWNIIKNIGQYNVKVFVTVMSFEEKIYQVLSGCKFPISQIEDNLRFIKKLRQEGIINYFEIATVVQDRNFRTLPEFVKKCIYEFEADSVRLRPYMPWGSQKPYIEWFMNVRNPLHPYYEEYREICKDPIFNNPKVHDWSGGNDSVTFSNEIPYKVDAIKKKILSDLILNTEGFQKKIINEDKEIIIYGIGDIGKAIIKLLHKKINILFGIDRIEENCQYEEIKIKRINEISSEYKSTKIIITPILDADSISKELYECGFNNIVKLKDFYEV